MPETCNLLHVVKLLGTLATLVGQAWLLRTGHYAPLLIFTTADNTIQEFGLLPKIPLQAIFQDIEYIHSLINISKAILLQYIYDFCD